MEKCNNRDLTDKAVD